MVRKQTTQQQRDLHAALKDDGFNVEMEKWDGYKHIDIACVASRVNIEIDGPRHNSHGKQALADLQRTKYSFEKGYYTIRIPNSLLEQHFDEAVELIGDILEEGEARGNE